MINIEPFSDEYFMKKALQEAIIAYEKKEVPIGAVVIANNKVIARAHNNVETLHDVTAHAEMQAITSAANYMGGKYLNQCTLYVTLEPCVMCAGGIAWSQLGRLVFGAYDEVRGYSKFSPTFLHPKTEVVGGILRDDCLDLVQDFFKKKREQ